MRKPCVEWMNSTSRGWENRLLVSDCLNLSTVGLGSNASEQSAQNCQFNKKISSFWKLLTGLQTYIFSEATNLNNFCLNDVNQLLLINLIYRRLHFKHVLANKNVTYISYVYLFICYNTVEKVMNFIAWQKLIKVDF